MARRVHGSRWPGAMPDLIHHEDGFNEDESVRRDWKRSLFRLAALPTAAAVVVPSTVLQRIAAREWGAGKRTRPIRNALAVADYDAPPSTANRSEAQRIGKKCERTCRSLRALHH